jgi:hypothetical protein
VPRPYFSKGTYFTTTPFQNCKHKSTTVTGTVEIAVDWEAPLDALREADSSKAPAIATPGRRTCLKAWNRQKRSQRRHLRTPHPRRTRELSQT